MSTATLCLLWFVDCCALQVHPRASDFFFDNEDCFLSWSTPLRSADDVLLGELLLAFFDWSVKHKVTDACAKASFRLLGLLLPSDADDLLLPKWSQLKALLEAVYHNCVVPVDICPNDCMAFYDCDHAKLGEYRHAERTSCMYCGASRNVTAADGSQRPAKVGYYFPLDFWMTSIFKDPALVDNIEFDVGDFPSGHTSYSKGWYEKVINNPHINCESRNQAIIGMSDGIPLFRDKNSRGVMPFALRLANLPDAASKRYASICRFLSIFLF